MESQPQNSEFRNIPESFYPCLSYSLSYAALLDNVRATCNHLLKIASDGNFYCFLEKLLVFSK